MFLKLWFCGWENGNCCEFESDGLVCGVDVIIICPGGIYKVVPDISHVGTTYVNNILNSECGFDDTKRTTMNTKVIPSTLEYSKSNLQVIYGD